MRPIALHGHEKAVTSICYNQDGDLLFTAAKYGDPCVWFTANGERLGTYRGKNAAIFRIDVDWTSRRLLTAAGNSTCKVWDVETGVSCHEIAAKTPVKFCHFSYCGNLLVFCTDYSAKLGDSNFFVYDMRELNSETPKPVAQGKPDATTAKLNASVWAPLDRHIICANDDGSLHKFDLRAHTFDSALSRKPHSDQIMDIQFHPADATMLITASKDTTAVLSDAYTLAPLKTYRTDRPVNSAAISPTHPHVLLGGGQEAGQVTTTAAAQGKFEARLFHMTFEEEFGRIKGHFGPINSVAFRRDGRGYSSGAEDGFVRMHEFDREYYDFDIEC